MTKCECGRLFNWWDKIVGTYTEHRIMCEALKVFKEERDEYRNRLREANLKIMRLEDEVRTEGLAEGYTLVHPSTTTATRFDSSVLFNASPLRFDTTVTDEEAKIYPHPKWGDMKIGPMTNGDGQ